MFPIIGSGNSLLSDLAKLLESLDNTCCSDIPNHDRILNYPAVTGYRVMFIGESPSFDPSLPRRRPTLLLSKSGELMNWILSELGLVRDDCYFTNAIKCANIATNEVGNVTLCLSILKQELELVKPKFIVTLGHIARKAVGSLGYWSVDKLLTHDQQADRWKFYPLPHPAIILRDPSKRDFYQSRLRRLKAVLDVG